MMFILKEQDKRFLIENIPGIKKIIQLGSKEEIQDAFYEWMDVNCFDESSNGSYNSLGIEASKVWDSIKNTK